ncbi:MAG: hypothetical protein V4505_15370 [Pseudomonadota bacterium]
MPLSIHPSLDAACHYDVRDAESFTLDRAERALARDFSALVLAGDMFAPVLFEPRIADFSARQSAGVPVMRHQTVQELVYEEQANADAHAQWFALVARAAQGEGVQAAALAAVQQLAGAYAARRVREGAGL